MTNEKKNGWPNQTKFERGARAFKPASSNTLICQARVEGGINGPRSEIGTAFKNNGWFLCKFRVFVCFAVKIFLNEDENENESPHCWAGGARRDIRESWWQLLFENQSTHAERVRRPNHPLAPNAGQTLAQVFCLPNFASPSRKPTSSLLWANAGIARQGQATCGFFFSPRARPAVAAEYAVRVERCGFVW